ncbi:3-hydroxyacyl-CoA dehydrogenase family protein, partial [Steroidobacter sp.]|uniref:3-hydroxyacyl-CoA dehydrogenase family protein n=1 Tax=Steroidobacter sp. TaxID=1978227 RepID=UPI001A5AF2EF
AIIGAGVMGTKVAWACARAGMPTRLFDVESGKATESVELAASWSVGAEAEKVQLNLRAAASLEDAVTDAQLAFENVPERLALKCEVAASVAKLLSPQAYMGSNASVLPCSPIAEASGRPERFFNMNFSDPRHFRLVELMTAPQAEPATVGFALAWARHIGMIPLQLGKENIGYSMNRLWRVVKKEVLRQIAEGISTPHNIDRAWMLAFGVSQGPCGLMDEIGLHSIRRVEQQYFELTGDPSDAPPMFLSQMIEAGRLGEGTGSGFYEYPDPAYRRRGWLEEQA